MFYFSIVNHHHTAILKCCSAATNLCISCLFWSKCSMYAKPKALKKQLPSPRVRLRQLYLCFKSFNRQIRTVYNFVTDYLTITFFYFKFSFAWSTAVAQLSDCHSEMVYHRLFMVPETWKQPVVTSGLAFRANRKHQKIWPISVYHLHFTSSSKDNCCYSLMKIGNSKVVATCILALL